MNNKPSYIFTCIVIILLSFRPKRENNKTYVVAKDADWPEQLHKPIMDFGVRWQTLDIVECTIDSKRADEAVLMHKINLNQHILHTP